jgi:antitoxin VapB
MGIHIKNEDACKLVRALAKAKGISLTDAVVDGVGKELDWTLRRTNLARDLRKISESIAPYAHLIPASDEIDALLYDEMGLPK